MKTLKIAIEGMEGHVEVQALSLDERCDFTDKIEPKENEKATALMKRVGAEVKDLVKAVDLKKDDGTHLTSVEDIYYDVDGIDVVVAIAQTFTGNKKKNKPSSEPS